MDRILIRISFGCLAKIAATDGDNDNNRNTNIPRAVKFGYDNFTLMLSPSYVVRKLSLKKTTGTASKFVKHLQRLHTES